MKKEKMSEKNKKALICAFFLSKFNRSGLPRLGCSTFNEAFARIGKQLGVNPNTVKNMRDEFDPIFGERKGWHQRPLRPSRKNLYDMFESMDIDEIMVFVRNCLDNNLKSAQRNSFLDSTLNALEGNQGSKRAVSSQMETGKKAERVFVRMFEKLKPGEGPLEDKTDSGCGYDFHTGTPSKRAYYEVKGSKASSGSVRFTEKEWNTAHREKKRYNLVHITNVNKSPKIRFINNPSRYQCKPLTTIVSQVYYMLKTNHFTEE
jgi:hypothetical protein